LAFYLLISPQLGGLSPSGRQDAAIQRYDTIILIQNIGTVQLNSSDQEKNMNDDHKLKNDVLAELAWEPSVVADDIGVTAKNGVVTLTGHVSTYWQKHAAETAAGRVQGLKALAEEIEIRLPFHAKRADDEIAAAALNHLSWDTSMPKDAVKVKVEKGYVTLTGQVDWHYQKELAASMIRSLTGVIGVANQLSIKLRPNASTISDDIMHALHRSWFFDDNNIKVSADGGNIHLTGTVDNWTDRQTAASTAWAAPGTMSVKNDIRVN
jgi:osmotically-inducible protein OsmY